MTRRTHPCLGCFDAAGDTPFNKPHRTRHKDQICSSCRRRGIYVRDGAVHVPIVINFRGRGA